MWGSNGLGQLGLNDNTNRSVPTLVTNLPSGVISQLELGENFSGALINGQIYMWGDNQYGQLGLDDTTNRNIPTLIPGYSSQISQIALGAHHAGAIIAGKIYMWGFNADAELGDNSTTNRSKPTIINTIANSQYTAIKLSLGSNHSGAIVLINGQTKPIFWGSNYYLQCNADPVRFPNAVSTPQDISSRMTQFGTAIEDISLGQNITSLIISGRIITFGVNDSGQLGQGNTTSVVPANGNANYAQISTLSGIVAGYKHMAGLSGNSLYMWGNNSSGQVGNGNTNNVATYANVLNGVSQVAAGSAFTMAVVNNVLYTWGSNSSGQLGKGTVGGSYNSVTQTNIKLSNTINLDATNDPNNSRDDVVYNVIKNQNNIRDIIEASSDEINLPRPGYNLNNIVATGKTQNGSGEMNLVVDKNDFAITTDITINGFKPVNNTQTTTTVPPEEVPLKDITFNGDSIFALIDEANADTTGTNSKLAKWIISNYLTNKNTYTVNFPENTKITKVDSFEAGDTGKGEIKFNITVDKYYKPSGNDLILSTSSDPAIKLTNKVHLLGLPKPISLEDCTDPLTTKIAVLETLIQPQTSTNAFFNALTGNINGGLVINKLLLSQYLNTRFIPVDANIRITRRQSPPVTPGLLDEPVDFTLTTDKYFSNGNLIEAPNPELSQNISFVIKPKISTIEAIQNNEAILSQITTGDAIKSMSSSNNIIAEASKYLNFENFPSQTFFSLGNNILNENEKGILDLSINADKYYDLTSFAYINQNKTFNNLRISGFKPAYSIKEYPIAAINEPPKGVSDKTEFYDKVIQNNVVDRAFLSQFVDLRAIPTDALLAITSMQYSSDNTILITIKTDRYYGTGGETIFKDYEATALVKLPTIDVVLIVILVSAGLFVMFLITCIVISIKNKNRIRITE